MSLSNNFPTTPPSLNLDFANVKALDPRVTFTRSTTATYYDGVTVAMAEQNLVPNSQNFSGSSWTQDAVALTGSQTAPDGTSTAWLFTDNVTNSDHRCYMFPAQLSSPSYTYSVYLKNGTRRYALMRLQYSFTSAGAIFDLQTGAVSSTGGSAYFSSSITSVGNGWYRCTVTTNAMTSGVGNVVIAMSNTSSYSDNITYSGTGDTMYVWGVQLEQRSSVTAYTATTTQPITNYIPVLQTAASGIPRFDHNPTTGESLGFLIEEARTNLVTYSEQFDNAAWTQSYLTENIVTNSAVSPSGQITADTIYDSSGNSEFAVGQTVSGASANTAHTLSIFAKASGSNFLYLRYYGNIEQYYYTVIFDLSLGTATKSQIGSSASNGSNTITSVGNGWYRLTVTATVNSGTLVPMIGIAASGTDTIGAFGQINVNGTGNRSCFIWGAQLEAGAFPTSYIATTTAAATRNADAASMTGTNFSSWYDIGEGAIYAEYTITFTSGNRYVLSLDKDISNYIEIGGNSTTNNVLLYQRQAGTLDVSIQGSSNVSTSSINKLAAGIATNNFAIYLNGISQGTDTSNFLVSGLTSLEIGRYNEGSPGGYFNSHIRRITYYPARLTNAQLQALTS